MVFTGERLPNTVKIKIQPNIDWFVADTQKLVKDQLLDFADGQYWNLDDFSQYSTYPVLLQTELVVQTKLLNQLRFLLGEPNINQSLESKAVLIGHSTVLPVIRKSLNLLIPLNFSIVSENYVELLASGQSVIGDSNLDLSKLCRVHIWLMLGDEHLLYLFF